MEMHLTGFQSLLGVAFEQPLEKSDAVFAQVLDLKLLQDLVDVEILNLPNKFLPFILFFNEGLDLACITSFYF